MILPPLPPLETDEDRKRVTDLFVALRIQTIIHYAHLFNDPCSKIASAFFLNALFRNGVSLDRSRKTLKRDAKQWLSQAYTSYGRDVMRWHFICGFAASTTFDYGGISREPVTIDLSQVTIMYYKPPVGRPEFRFFLVTDDSMGPSPFQHLSNEITNVTVFVMDTPPDRDGTLHSIMSVLQADIEREHNRLRHLTLADEHRANPRIVLQVEATQHSDKKMMSDVSLPLASQTNKTTTVDIAGNWHKHRMLRENADLLRKVNNIGYDQAQELIKDMMEHEPETMTLPTGRTYVSAQLPEAPDNVLEWRAARMKTVSELFHIPMEMFSQASTNTAGSKTGSSNKTTKGDENNSVMFNSAIKRYKVELVALFRHMYKEVFRPLHVGEFFTEMQKTGKNITDLPDAEQLIEENVDDIQIEIPGIPDQAVLTELYVGGFLKYHSFCDLTAQNLEINPSYFNPFPALTIKEANGIQPKPPVASSSSQPKKKKAKTS